MKKPASVEVIEEEGKPVEKKVLAAAIVEISAAMKRLLGSGLNRRAIIILTQAAIKQPGYGRKAVGRADVTTVIEAIESLSKIYT